MAKLGIKAKAYYRSAGSYESPTWTEITLLSDFAVNPSWDEGEANDRGSRVKMSAKTLLGLEFSGKLKKKPGNAVYEAVMDALVGDDVLDLLVLDGDIEADGTRGWRVDCQVHQANEDQGLGTVMYEDITFKPYPSDNPPYAVKVGGTGDLNLTQPGDE